MLPTDHGLNQSEVNYVQNIVYRIGDASSIAEYNSGTYATPDN